LLRGATEKASRKLYTMLNLVIICILAVSQKIPFRRGASISEFQKLK